MEINKTVSQKKLILLTGGAGFLGKAIIQELLDKSSPIELKELRVFDLNQPEKPYDARIKFIKGDVKDRAALMEACKGVDLVIHSAAIVDWGTKSREEVFSANVDGTNYVIEACESNQVKGLVYTASLDVLHDGKPKVDVDEETPYPDKHSTSYCESKYLGELSVLEANGDGLLSCSLRPADIYGEGDPFHIGSLIDMAKGGFYVRIGDGRSLCQHVYVGNMAHAHVLAAHALLSGNTSVAGQAYFVTDGPPINFFTFFDSFVTGAGYRIRPRNLWLPRWFAYMLGCLSESIAFLLRPIKKYNPKMSRFAVNYICTDYTFTAEKAKRDFGFIPKYDKQEAFRRTMEFFRISS